MISHASDLPISVLVPAPRVCDLFKAGAVPPEQVENVKTQTTKTKILSESTIEIDLEIVWTPVPTDPLYYDLRIMNDNTTNNARNIHTEEETVRIMSHIIVSQTESLYTWPAKLLLN